MTKYNEKVTVELEASDWFTVRMALYSYGGEFLDEAIKHLKEGNEARWELLMEIHKDIADIAFAIKERVKGVTNE